MTTEGLSKLKLSYPLNEMRIIDNNFDLFYLVIKILREI